MPSIILCCDCLYIVTKCIIHLQELCSEVMVQLGEAGLPSEAFSVYNMMRYSKRTVCKSLHEKVLGILVPAGLLKDAYIVIKVLCFWRSLLVSLLFTLSVFTKKMPI
jgi:hypothetical protein